MPLTPFETGALFLSLQVSAVAVIVSLLPGVAIAWLLARHRFPGKTLVDGVIHLPLVLPPVVVGYALLVLLGRDGMVGAWLHDALGVTFAFNWKGAALASAVMAFPLLVRPIRLSLETVDRGLETAARTLGAGRARVFLTVTLPLAAPGLLAGAILAFARGFGEFGATLTFVSSIPGETQTLPLALYSLVQPPSDEAAAMRLLAISVLLSLASLAASAVIARRADRRVGSAT
ncbi:MAG TPA: molybdate ABC transporter permease subunit [Stellaceae bacterium]|nr:molybdate ABC transporter permease subunit [Stellaceae bacterium]